MHALLMHEAAPVADTTSHIAGGALLVVLGIALLAYAALFVGALISILASQHGAGTKLAWIVVAFVAPFLGSLLWFLAGRGDARRRAIA